MPNKFHASDIHALKAQALTRLPQLVECLFSGRTIHRATHEYRVGTKGSISVRIADGSYFNHETSAGGDIFTLIQDVLRTDFKGALAWAHDFAANMPLTPVILTENLQKKIDERAVRQRDKAIALWKRAEPIKETLANAYLRTHRGIALSPLPGALAFIAHAYNFSAGGFYPAMIAKMQNVDGDIVAAHCTFLDEKTGNKLVGEGVKPRLIFGACRGSTIRLAQATERLALCEGIEDGLSILQECPELPVWACAGTSGLRAVQIPSHVRDVLICSDNDTAGKEAADDLSTRLVNEGRNVRIATPPAGVKDFNDLLRQGGSRVK